MKISLALPITCPGDVWLSENEEFDELVLLLHGFQLDGRFMFKRYAPLFGDKVKVVSPNAPFLVPLKKEKSWEPRYSWYFYDSARKNFYVNYEPAARWLADLLEKINPLTKKTTIIGYSQGGYLAPKVAELVSSASTVLGINCVFRSSRFDARSDVEYIQLNGTHDKIVSPNEAKQEFDTLLKKGAKGRFIETEAEHLLTRSLVEQSFNLL